MIVKDKQIEVMLGMDDNSDELLPIITEEDEAKDKKESIPSEIPILPIKNTVLFPGQTPIWNLKDAKTKKNVTLQFYKKPL